MQNIFVLVVLGALLSASWTTLATCLAIVVMVIAAGCYIVLRLHGNIGSPIGNNRTAIDRNYVAALEAMVVDAETQVEALRSEIERLRAAPSISEPDPRTALYHRVGLSSGAPDWLILAARRAYRAKLHPDRHPEPHKWEADHRFKLAEAAFDAIASSRL